MGMFGAIGAGIGATGSLLEGEAAFRSAKFTAEQLRRNAAARDAQGLRQASALRKQGKRAGSNLLAESVAGGQLSTDPSAIRLQAEFANATAFNSLAAIFQAKTEAGGIRNAAKAAIFEGKLARRMGQIKAAAEMMNAFDQMGGMGGGGGGGGGSSGGSIGGGGGGRLPAAMNLGA